MSFWKELKQGLQKSVKTASEKSQQMVEISRLNLRIRGKKEDVNRLFLRFGILAFDAWNKDEGDRLVLSREMKEILQSIRQVQADITAMERELLSIRGKVDCPACGAVFDLGTNKCPACQTPIRDVTTFPQDDPFTAARPQSSDVSSHQRQSEDFISQSGSDDENEANEERTLAEFQTMTGKTIFVCPKCGNQLQEYVNVCSFCGEKFV